MDQPRAAIEEAGVCVRVCALNLWESDSCLPKLQEPPGVLEEHLGVFDTKFRTVVWDSFVCFHHPGSAGFTLETKVT